MVTSGDTVLIKPVRLHGAVYKVTLEEPNDLSPRNTVYEARILSIEEEPPELDPVMSVDESLPLAEDDLDTVEEV